MQLRRKSKLKILSETVKHPGKAAKRLTALRIVKRPGKAAKGFTALRVLTRPRKAAKGFAAFQVAKRPGKAAKAAAAFRNARRMPVRKRLPIVAGAALAAFGASKALGDGGQTA